mmetsp:Transcript_53802/g.64920  ORF Transcript_53802/g.64920 Transcript_53802/m.64920 type:complete len:340 (+) Transcript_53802:158-1177(+)|eukprot:CAMPEP_0172485538 /NCGR_PEP_ID=MMETSP1066-20121228/13596_1 /TAXON_ID=671091 /ORGANISM="Coscinodiscus wailesii, Strain CCMP2513" /LENGTH=339 /DNA_ID=CAMNT_0013250853 /DNA_START=150 /DNA_END=1169 /DNA_ORIENTATION=-
MNSISYIILVWIFVLIASIFNHHILKTFSDQEVSHIEEATIRPLHNERLTLEELVGSTENYKCPPNLFLAKDSFAPTDTAGTKRKIPKIIHITGKTRCLSKVFHDIVNSWRFPDHTLVFHDDDAVDRLLFQRHYPEFPHLQTTLRCMVSGAAKADVWRYLVIWEYGGVYTDLDNLPGELFLRKDVIRDDTDAFFEQEIGMFPSQYFFAASPRHPLMYYSMMHALMRLMDVKNVTKLYVPFVTGPGASKSAMINFIGEGRPGEGIYKGTHNRSVTVVDGNMQPPNKYVYRGGKLRGNRKNIAYREMNMTHFGEVKSTYKDSCIDLLYEETVLAAAEDGQN